MDVFAALLREALIVTAVLTLPVLAIATLAGLAVAILQAATQVQEQTLSLLPKVLAVAAMLVIFGRFGMALVAGLLTDICARIPLLARG